MADLGDWMQYAEPDPEWEQVVKDHMGGHAPDLATFKTIDDLREWISQSKKAMSATMGDGKVEGITETDHQVEVRDGTKITCRVYKKSGAEPGPLVVIYHGGGFCIGGLENEELLCRLVADKLNCVAVNVDYRLAPEHIFPAAVLDSYDATKWAAANASSLGADPNKGFIIGGTSAGGNITAVVSHQARDDKLSPPITGTLLMIPALVDFTVVPDSWKADYRSLEQNEHAPILSKKAIELFMSNYNPEGHMDDPRMSPALWPTGHAGLPPAVFQICGLDPLRDEALIVERIMREEHKINTKVYMYSGQPHGFWSVAPTMEASKKFVTESVEGVKWLLEQK